MDIKQVLEEKAAAENKIMEVLEEFRRKTGFSASGVTISRASYFGLEFDSAQEFVMGVKIEVQL